MGVPYYGAKLQILGVGGVGLCKKRVFGRPRLIGEVMDGLGR